MTNKEAINLLGNHFNWCPDCRRNKAGDCENCMCKATELAISALKAQDKYRWHDLRKNPEDLPPKYKEIEVYATFRDDGEPISPNNCEYDIAALYSDGFYCWHMHNLQTVSEVIAWREIEPFEEELK